MQTQQRFSADILRLLEQTEEVQIEPRSPDRQRTQPVTIWVVVADGDVYVRSARGASGRWYQSLLKSPRGVLHVDGREISFRASRVEDPRTISRVSEAYRQKYEQKWPTETAELLRDEVISTTLRLEPDVT